MSVAPSSSSAPKLSSTKSTNTTSETNSGTEKTQDIASQRLMANYSTFLSMLTTQLRVQNPLEPMDAEKFTEQLVQYSGVEQQIMTNQNLEAMLGTLLSSTTLSLVNYLGKTIEANSATALVKDGKGTWKMDAAAEAKDAEITIRNEAGAIVYEGKMTLKKGENTFDWDGKTKSGTAPDGAYTISIKATDKDGKAVAVTTKVKGVVEGIDTSRSEPYLKLNGTSIPLSSLLSIAT